MKIKSIFAPFLLILVSIFLTFIMLNWNDYGWVSIVALIAFAGAVIYSLITNDFAPLFAVLIAANHSVFFEGTLVFRLISFGIVVFVLALLSLIEGANKRKFFLYSCIPIAIYLLIIIGLRPNKVRFDWYVLYFETACFFAFTQLFTWNIKKIQKVVLIHLVYISIFGIIEQLFFVNNRLAGPMQSPTVFGVVLVLLWSLWFSIELLSKKPDIAKAVGISLPVFVVILWTGTRMGLVGFVLTFILLLIFKVYTTSISLGGKIYLLVLSLLVLFVAIYVVWTILPDNMIIKAGFKSLLEGKIDLSNMGRLVVWWVAYNAFLSYPVFGIGNGNFMEFTEKFYEQMGLTGELTELFSLSHAHNVFLIILSENGIVGFLVALTVLVVCIVSIITNLKQSKDNRIFGLLIGLCVMMALGMVDAVPYFPSTQLWGVWLFAVIIQLKPDNIPEKNEMNILATKNVQPEIESR